MGADFTGAGVRKQIFREQILRGQIVGNGLEAALELALERVERGAAAGLWDEVCDALPVLMDHWESVGKPGAIAERVAQVMGAVVSFGDGESQRAVARLWRRLGMPGIAVLQGILLDGEEDFHGRWLAGRSLGELGAAGMTEARDTVLRLLAQQRDEETLAIVSGAVTHMGAPAIEALGELLHQPESRPAAVRSLVKICHPDIVTPLLTVMDDPDPQVRAIALEAIGNFQDRRSLPLLLKALEDTASVVRREAVRGLGQKAKMLARSQDGSALPDLEKLDFGTFERILIERLRDFDVEVCRQAAIALGRLQTCDAVTALTETLLKNSTPVPLRKSVVQALVWSDRSDALAALGDYLETAIQNPNRRWADPGQAGHASQTIQSELDREETIHEIIQMLGRVTVMERRSQARQIIHRWWTTLGAQSSTDLAQRVTVPVREAIAQSLGQLNHPESHPDSRPILNLLAQDPTPSVRYRAEAALRMIQ